MLRVTSNKKQASRPTPSHLAIYYGIKQTLQKKKTQLTLRLVRISTVFFALDITHSNKLHNTILTQKCHCIRTRQSTNNTSDIKCLVSDSYYMSSLHKISTLFVINLRFSLDYI